jgi:hypothetical protein
MGEKKSRIAGWTLIGTLLTIIGIVTPIVWDYFKSRTSLEVQLLDRIVIVNPELPVPGLQITYKNSPINVLYRLDLRLRNSGRVPIRPEDVLRPLSITFENKKLPLDFWISKRQPEDVEVLITVNKDAEAIELKPHLLNPSDSVDFSLLFGDVTNINTLHARITGVHDVDFVDLSAVEKDRPIPTRVWIVATFSSLALLLAIGFLVNVKRQYLLRRKHVQNKEPLPPITSLDECEAFIKSKLTYFSTASKRKLLAKLTHELSEAGDTAEVRQERAKSVLLEAIQSGDNDTVGFIVMVVMAIAGAWYVASSIM